MSLAGLGQFDQNLRYMMESKAFEKADDIKRLQMSYALLNSKYGAAYSDVKSLSKQQASVNRR